MSFFTQVTNNDNSTKSFIEASLPSDSSTHLTQHADSNRCLTRLLTGPRIVKRPATQTCLRPSYDCLIYKGRSYANSPSSRCNVLLNKSVWLPLTPAMRCLVSSNEELGFNLDWIFVEDPETLNGTSRPEIRFRHRERAAGAIESENPRAERFGAASTHGSPQDINSSYRLLKVC